MAKREHIESSTTAVGQQTVRGGASFQFKYNVSLQQSNGGLDGGKRNSVDCTKQIAR